MKKRRFVFLVYSGKKNFFKCLYQNNDKERLTQKVTFTRYTTTENIMIVSIKIRVCVIKTRLRENCKTNIGEHKFNSRVQIFIDVI